MLRFFTVSRLALNPNLIFEIGSKLGGITAAGPLPILTGFPIKPLTGTLSDFLKDMPAPVKGFLLGQMHLISVKRNDGVFLLKTV